ncbi:MAG: ATP-dependent acyl-CoA ligase [Betaproteobacteria bacterium]|nr:ATP-dependent acyl-CoA ligase [Betaproteobacteria bacterium]
MVVDASPFAGFDLASLLETRAQQRAGHPFLVWAPFAGQGEPLAGGGEPMTGHGESASGHAETWSYARFADEAARVAGGLAARGVRPGDRVMVMLENCPEALLTLFACARLGAVYVPVNAMAAGAELDWYVGFTGAVGAVTQPKFAALVAAHCRGLKWLAVTRSDAGTPAAVGSVPAAAESFSALYGEPLPRRAPDPAAPALILFTTGTTSRPKGVLWTHANALWGGRLGALQQALRGDDVYQIFLPLYHVVALSWSFLPALWAGATVLLQPRFSASRYWGAALAHRATVGSQVIFTARVLAQQPAPASHAFRQWVDALCLHQFEAHFGVRILGAWGMTEMVGQGIIGDPWLPQRSGSIGRPSPAYGIRIEDDDGCAVEPGGTGNLLVRGVPGVSIFANYVDDARATADAFDEGGYFRTGDRVILHPDGFIQFADRAKDVIKVGGEGVSPAEVERVVLEVAGVRGAAVVARPDADYGEVVVAFVELDTDGRDPQAGVSESVATIPARVIAHCRASLAKFKVPRDVIVVPALPRVGFGKIAKNTLRDSLHDTSHDTLRDTSREQPASATQ